MAPVIGNCCLRFGEHDSTIRVPSETVPTLGKNHTVSFWIRFMGSQVQDNFYSIYDPVTEAELTTPPDNDNKHFPFVFFSGDLTYQAYRCQINVQIARNFIMSNHAWTDGAPDCCNLTTNYNFLTNQWYHVVVTVEELTTCKHYVNGRLLTTFPMNGTFGPPTGSRVANDTGNGTDGYHDYLIGCAYDSDYWEPTNVHPTHAVVGGKGIWEEDPTRSKRWFALGADLDEVLVYSRAFDEVEISDLFTYWYEHYGDTWMSFNNGDCMMKFHFDEGAGDTVENLGFGPNGTIQNCLWLCEGGDWPPGDGGVIPPGGGGPSYPVPKIWSWCIPDPVSIGEKTNVTWVTSYANFVDIYENIPNSRYIGQFTTVGSIPYYPSQYTKFHLKATRTDEPKGAPDYAWSYADVHLYGPQSGPGVDLINGNILLISDSGNYRIVGMGTASLDYRGALGTVNRYQYGSYNFDEKYPIYPTKFEVDSRTMYFNEGEYYYQKHHGVTAYYNRNQYGAIQIAGEYRFHHGVFESNDIWGNKNYTLGFPKMFLGQGANVDKIYLVDSTDNGSSFEVRDRATFTLQSCVSILANTRWPGNPNGWGGHHTASGYPGFYGYLNNDIAVHPSGGKVYTGRVYPHNGEGVAFWTEALDPPTNLLRMYDINCMEQAAIETLAIVSSMNYPVLYVACDSEFVYGLHGVLVGSSCFHKWDANSLTLLDTSVVGTPGLMTELSNGRGIATHNGYVYAFGNNGTTRHYINQIDPRSGWMVVQSWGNCGSRDTLTTSLHTDSEEYLFRPQFPTIDPYGLLWMWDSKNFTHKAFHTDPIAYYTKFVPRQVFGQEGRDNMFYEPQGIEADWFTPDNMRMYVACPGAGEPPGDFYQFAGTDFKGYGTSEMHVRNQLNQYAFGRKMGSWDASCWQLGILNNWTVPYVNGRGIDGGYEPDPPDWGINPVGITLDGSCNAYLSVMDQNYSYHKIMRFDTNLNLMKVNCFAGGGVYPNQWFNGFDYWYEFRGITYDTGNNYLWMAQDFAARDLFWMTNSLVWVGSREVSNDVPGTSGMYVRDVTVCSNHLFAVGYGLEKNLILKYDRNTMTIVQVHTATNPQADPAYSSICNDGVHLYCLDPINGVVDKYRANDFTFVLRSLTKCGVGSGHLFGSMGITWIRPVPRSMPFYACDDTPNVWPPLTFSPAAREFGDIPFHMFKIRIGSGTGDYIALQNSDKPLNWGGKVWQVYPANVGPVKFRAIPSNAVKVTASNVSRELVKEMILHRVGKEVTVYKCYWNNDFTHTEPYVLFNGQVEQFNVEESDTSASVSMELKTDHWNWTHQVPNHGFGMFCNWRFKSTTPGCQYTGVQTVCDKSWKMCNKYGNDARYRGFRYMSELEDKVIWWGKEKKL